MRSRGFTLIELAVTIAIAGVLVLISVPSFLRYRENAELRSAANVLASDLRLAAQKASVAATAVSSRGGDEILSIPHNPAGTLVEILPGDEHSYQVLLRDNTAWKTLRSNAFSKSVRVSVQAQNTSTAQAAVLISFGAAGSVGFQRNGTPLAPTKLTLSNDSKQITVAVNSMGTVQVSEQ